MSTVENPNTDIEAGGGRRKRPSAAGSSEATTDGSRCFSDSDDQSWHSPLDSTAGGSFDECRFSEIEGISDPRSHKQSSVSDSLSYDVDSESGDLELKVHSAKEERDCRICHLNLVGSTGNQEIGIAIELGCSCKGDLGAAHKQCAETWFQIKGNTTCEICGATAVNVVGEQTSEANSTSATATAAPMILAERRRFWHGRRIMNFLLACMVFAFVISWLFHFNVLS
uniref:RING-CH-type domain-containing protein n=1 Tax=Davidia involucrata TaxID=16924 RepID=A0A5B7BZD6_DAVIN